MNGSLIIKEDISIIQYELEDHSLDQVSHKAREHMETFRYVKVDYVLFLEHVKYKNESHIVCHDLTDELLYV